MDKEQEEIELQKVRFGEKGRTVITKEDLSKTIENIDTASGKIVIENGIKFIKQLRAEASRQADIRKAKLNTAALPIEDLPVITTDPELDRLADSLEIYEEDDS